MLDKECKTPSLLAKWMPSENASSSVTKAKARWFMSELGYSAKEYRKLLSGIRAKLNILETLMFRSNSLSRISLAMLIFRHPRINDSLSYLT